MGASATLVVRLGANRQGIDDEMTNVQAARKVRLRSLVLRSGAADSLELEQRHLDVAVNPPAT